MKKFILLFTCLIISLGINAQWYRAGSRAGNNMANYAHSMKLTSMRLNAWYELHKNNYTTHKEKKPQTFIGDDIYDVPLTSDEKDPTSWMKHFIIFGGGIGGGSINPTGNLSHGSFDLDLIFLNVLFSVKFGGLVDTQGYDFADANSFQFGALIPIVTFDKSEYLFGQKGKIFIAPVIGFISADETYIDGEFFHSGANRIEGHNCQWWIDESRVKNQNCTEYGGALMVKYGCGYLLGKFTNKSWGLSIGLCM